MGQKEATDIGSIVVRTILFLSVLAVITSLWYMVNSPVVRYLDQQDTAKASVYVNKYTELAQLDAVAVTDVTRLLRETPTSAFSCIHATVDGKGYLYSATDDTLLPAGATTGVAVKHLNDTDAFNELATMLTSKASDRMCVVKVHVEASSLNYIDINVTSETVGGKLH